MCVCTSAIRGGNTLPTFLWSTRRSPVSLATTGAARPGTPVSEVGNINPKVTCLLIFWLVTARECGTLPSPPPGGRVTVKNHGLQYGIVDQFGVVTLIGGGTGCEAIVITHGEWTNIPGTPPLMESSSLLHIDRTNSFEEIAMLLLFSRPVEPSEVMVKPSDDPLVSL